MKVVGFTFIRNAIKYDYPIVEAIQSILPLCDYVVVALGDSEDNTSALLNSLPADKLKIIRTTWDQALREGGRVLAEETNKAFRTIPPDTDWCIYIQGDEVLHEDGYQEIMDNMNRYLNDKEVEGFLLKYRHFYGSYDYIGDSRRWYRREIRILRYSKDIESWRDAQGFRKRGKKLRVRLLQAHMHHYGWVKHPENQQQKQLNFNKWWHDDEWVEKNIAPVDQFDYSLVNSLKRFYGTHPRVMQQRVDKVNWQFSFDPSRQRTGIKESFLHWIEKRIGFRPGEYRNYKLLK